MRNYGAKYQTHFKNLPPLPPLLPNPLLHRLKSLHPLRKLLLQLRPIVLLKSNLRIHSRINERISQAIPRARRRRALKLIFIPPHRAIIARFAMRNINSWRAPTRHLHLLHRFPQRRNRKRLIHYMRRMRPFSKLPELRLWWRRL